MVTYLYKRYHKKLEQDFQRLALPQIKEYEASIAQACPGTYGIWEFIDGTVRPVARPLVDQEDYYSGHKGYHEVKYQGIVIPGGLISSLYGPDFGPVGDWKLWKECGIEQYLRALFKGSRDDAGRDDPMLYLYGDPAYSLSYGVIGPYSSRRAGVLTSAQLATNVQMCSAWIVVEWAFGLVLSQFSHEEKKRSQQTGLPLVGAYYVVAVLLTNCQTCLR